MNLSEEKWVDDGVTPSGVPIQKFVESRNLSEEAIDNFLYKYRQLVRQEKKRSVVNGEYQELQAVLTALFTRGQVEARIDELGSLLFGEFEVERVYSRMEKLNTLKASLKEDV